MSIPRGIDRSTGIYDLTVVIPMFNEQGNAARTLREITNVLQQLSITWEILVIDDGSTDKTLMLIKDFSKNFSNIRVFSHERNLGIGKALQTGVRNSKGKVIVTIDADLSYDPRDIPRLLENLKDDVDAVFGSPYMKGVQIPEASFLRVVISKSATSIYQKVTGTKLSCFTSIFRAYRKRAIKNLSFDTSGFEMQTEMAIRLLEEGCRIIEIPVTLVKRERGFSKFKYRREIPRHFKLLLKVLIRRARKFFKG